MGFTGIMLFVAKAQMQLQMNYSADVGASLFLINLNRLLLLIKIRYTVLITWSNWIYNSLFFHSSQVPGSKAAPVVIVALKKHFQSTETAFLVAT